MGIRRAIVITALPAVLIASTGCGVVLGSQGVADRAAEDLKPVAEAPDAAPIEAGGGFVAPTTTLPGERERGENDVAREVDAAYLPGETPQQYTARMKAIALGDVEFVNGDPTAPGGAGATGGGTGTGGTPGSAGGTPGSGGPGLTPTTLPSLPGIPGLPVNVKLVYFDTPYCNALDRLTVAGQDMWSSSPTADRPSLVKLMKEVLQALVEFAAVSEGQDRVSLEATVTTVRARMAAVDEGWPIAPVISSTAPQVTPFVFSAVDRCFDQPRNISPPPAGLATPDEASIGQVIGDR